MYDENNSECWTAAANSKTENIMRRRNTALYEKNGNDLQIPDISDIRLKCLFLHFIFFVSGDCSTLVCVIFLVFLTLWLIFSQCVMINDVWTVSANTVELDCKLNTTVVQSD